MKTKRKTPDIRFRGFTDDWEQRKLGELMEITSVRRIHQSDWTDEGVRFLRARDVVSAYKKEDPVDKLYISREKYDSYSILSGKVSIGDLLVTGVGTIGVPLLITDETPIYFKDGNIIWFKNNNKIFGYFLFYSYIGDKIQRFISNSAGTGTVSTYTIQTGKETPILFPIVDEQKKIGSFFSELDTTITLHQRKLQQLKEVKRGMLLALLSCDKENYPTVRFNEYKNIWETIKLGDDYKFLKGKGLPLKEFSNEGKLKGIAYGHLYTIYSEVILDVNLFVTEETVKSKSGDLLFPGSSTVPFGTAQTNAIMIDGVNLGGDIVIARPKDNSNYAPFMSYLINKMKEKMYPITVGTTITHMYGKDISKLKYSIPKYEEQLKIGKFIQKLDRMIELQEREIELLEDTKEGFLQKMFV